RNAVSIGNTFATSAAAYVDNQGTLTGNIGVAVGGADTGDNTVTNAGAIVGTSGTALQFGAGNNLLVDDPGAVFSGIVEGGAGNNTLELASGSATGTLSGLGTSFVDFGTVRVDPGAVWQVSDAASAVPAFVNDGTVLVTGGNTLEFGAVAEDAGDSGVIGVGSSGVAEFQSTVAASQTVSFLDATGMVKLDAPAQFGATIAGFVPGAILKLGNTVATNATPGTFNGTTTPLTVNLSGGGTLTYGLAGNLSSDTFNVTLVNSGTDSDITVAGLAGEVTLSTATEGTALPGTTTVATFTDTNTSDTAGNFTATIDWGDGTTTAGMVSGANGAFAVAGGHTYADEGSDTLSVTITDTLNSATTSPSGTVTVAEGDTLAANPITFAASVGQPFTGTVASFTDPTYPNNVASDFTATIDW